MRAREISVSAVSAAIASLLLGFGYALTAGEFFWYFAASAATALPLLGEKPSVRGALCAYLAASALSTALVGFNFIFLLPFYLPFGPFPALDAVLKARLRFPAVRIALEGAYVFLGVFAMLAGTRLFGLPLFEMPDCARNLALMIALAGAVPAAWLYGWLLSRVLTAVRRARAGR